MNGIAYGERPKNYYDQFRWIAKWRLWEPIPRDNRLVAHIESRVSGRTRCGLPIARGVIGRLVAVHETVSRAIDADDCKSCLRGES